MQSNKINLGDLVNQKEGHRKNGLILRVENIFGPHPPRVYFLVEWPGGERQKIKSGFVEKIINIA